MLVEKIIGHLEDFSLDELKIDKVLLAHYELIKPHQKLKSQGGMELAVSLPHGVQLFCGAVLYRDEKKLVVVDLIPEDVLEIRPKGNLEWGKVAFNIGNMHQPAYLFDDCILIPYDGIMERLIKNLGAEYKRTNRKLNGIRANVTLQSNEHNHSHGHSHSHSHEHSHHHSQE